MAGISKTTTENTKLAVSIKYTSITLYKFSHLIHITAKQLSMNERMLNQPCTLPQPPCCFLCVTAGRTTDSAAFVRGDLERAWRGGIQGGVRVGQRCIPGYFAFTWDNWKFQLEKLMVCAFLLRKLQLMRRGAGKCIFAALWNIRRVSAWLPQEFQAFFILWHPRVCTSLLTFQLKSFSP